MPLWSVNAPTACIMMGDGVISNEVTEALSAVRTIPLTGLVEIKQGGNGEQGTWIHY